MGTTGADLVAAIDKLAPPSLAESWDNVGLLAGDRGAALAGPALLTIDLTERVMDEAESIGAGAIIAYHPVIFSPIKRLTADDAKQRLVLRAVRAGMLIYSPHTAIDAAPGGLNDWLVSGVGDGDCRALTMNQDTVARVKIVTFVPPAHVERVRNALASASAGRIGGYELCSFAAPGTGTFLGGEGTNPAIGEAGRLESVDELRLEMICNRASTALAIETLRSLHPYEEPAIDVYELAPLPLRNAGSGRRVMLDQPLMFTKLLENIKAHLGVERVKYATPWQEPDHPVRSVGVCAGAGQSLLGPAADQGCDVFLTGEMRHHEILSALERNIAVVLAGHTNTERGYMPTFAKRLAQVEPSIEFRVSEVDRTPVRWA